MSSSLDPTGITSLTNFNPLKEYAGIYKNYLKEINSGNKEADSSFDAIKDPTKIKDQELVNDLKVLMQDEKNSNGIATSGIDALTPDNAAKMFSNILDKSINGLNDSQKASEKTMETFASGGKIDLHTVMIAAEKANLNMQLAVQIRGKILQAYQEISRMSV